MLSQYTCSAAGRQHLREDTKKGLTILLYHGVTRTKSRGIENYSNKHIQENVFRKQMKYIKKHCSLMSIDDVVEVKSSEENYPPRAVVVSFDDGFRNNYTVAAPILDELDIPAVFYICSGMVNTNLMFWVDSIEDCINSTAKKNIKMRHDTVVDFDLSTPPAKIRAVEEIKKYCKDSEGFRKDEVIEELIDKTGVKPDINHSENYYKLSWNELKLMSENSLFTIGGHSLYHDILSMLPRDQLNANIGISLHLIEYHLRKTVHYSYPEGQQDHYNGDVIAVLKKYGVICCPSAINGINNSHIDLFNLRRIMVGFMQTPFPFI
jgi:peptidoglycan/xylan/chitin deacetylase (PgdA/CDA1 family)